MPEAAGPDQADRLRHSHAAREWPASPGRRPPGRAPRPGCRGRPRPPSCSRRAWSSPTWRTGPGRRAGRGPLRRAGRAAPGPACRGPGRSPRRRSARPGATRSAQAVRGRGAPATEPCRSALLTSSDTITATSSASTSRPQPRRVRPVNSRAAPAGQAQVRRARNDLAAYPAAAGSGRQASSPEQGASSGLGHADGRRVLTVAPPPVRTGASAVRGTFRRPRDWCLIERTASRYSGYDATQDVHLQILMHVHPRRASCG